MSPEASDKTAQLAIWRTLALTLTAAFVTGLSGWIAFGLDSVKHSEIDGIMATRAPWTHERPRVEDALRFLKERDGELFEAIRGLEQRVRELERRHKQEDHP